MKNWLKNLLFVIFSFAFLGVGMIVAEIFIREKGNPLKDPNFLADAPMVDSTNISPSLPIDSTQGWMGDTIEVKDEYLKKEPKKEAFIDTPKSNGDYDVVIGIFGERSNANRQVKKLKELGYNNAYSFSKLSMDVVSAGQFEKEDAQKIAEDLKDKGFEAIAKHH
jgi:cell division septation protein DedD